MIEKTWNLGNDDEVVTQLWRVLRGMKIPFLNKISMDEEIIQKSKEILTRILQIAE